MLDFRSWPWRGIGEGLAVLPWLNGTGAEDDLVAVSPAAAQWGAGDTMRWLRRYNSTASACGDSPLTFAGIDLPNAGGSFAPALDPLETYISTQDPALVPTFDRVRAVTDRIDGGSALVAAQVWSQLEPTDRDVAVAGLARIALRTTALQPHYEPSEPEFAHHTAGLLAQSALTTAYMLQAAADIVSGASMELDASVRDLFMAEAVLTMTQASDDKVVVLAHNNHVQKTPVVFSGRTYALPMGSYLARWLGGDYRVVAQTTTADHVPDMLLDSASPVGFRVADVDLPPPAAGTFEGALVAAGTSQRPSLTDTRPGRGMPTLLGIRSQAGIVDTDVSAAFDAVLNHPQITKQTDLGF